MRLSLRRPSGSTGQGGAGALHRMALPQVRVEPEGVEEGKPDGRSVEVDDERRKLTRPEFRGVRPLGSRAEIAMD